MGYTIEVAVRTAVSVCRSFLADATAEPTWTAASCFILGCVSLAYVLTIHQGVPDVNTELQTFRKSFTGRSFVPSSLGLFTACSERKAGVAYATLCRALSALKYLFSLSALESNVRMVSWSNPLTTATFRIVLRSIVP